MAKLRRIIDQLRGRATGFSRLGQVLPVLVGLAAEPALAQTAAPAPPTVRASPELQARIAEFEARIVDLARALADEPRLRGLPPQRRQKQVEFVVGNIVFVATHELGHAVISELDLPVLGREEDTADVFAILTALRVVGSEFSHRILAGATAGNR